MSRHFTHQPTKDQGGAASVRSGGRGNDPESQHLQDLSETLGNAEMQRRLEEVANDRDALLVFIHERLKAVQSTQILEHHQANSPERWYRDVNLRRDSAPNPRRWHHAAWLYRAAAQDLVAGQLGRGAQLIRDAAAAESAAFESLPRHIETRLGNQQAPPQHLPAPVDRLNDEATCPPSPPPKWTEIADRILSLDPEVHIPRLPRIRARAAWWGKGDEDGDGEGDSEEG